MRSFPAGRQERGRGIQRHVITSPHLELPQLLCKRGHFLALVLQRLVLLRQVTEQLLQLRVPALYIVSGMLQLHLKALCSALGPLKLRLALSELFLRRV